MKLLLTFSSVLKQLLRVNSVQEKLQKHMKAKTSCWSNKKRLTHSSKDIFQQSKNPLIYWLTLVAYIQIYSSEAKCTVQTDFTGGHACRLHWCQWESCGPNRLSEPLQCFAFLQSSSDWQVSSLSASEPEGDPQSQRHQRSEITLLLPHP